MKQLLTQKIFSVIFHTFLRYTSTFRGTLATISTHPIVQSMNRRNCTVHEQERLYSPCTGKIDQSMNTRDCKVNEKEWLHSPWTGETVQSINSRDCTVHAQERLYSPWIGEIVQSMKRRDCTVHEQEIFYIMLTKENAHCTIHGQESLLIEIREIVLVSLYGGGGQHKHECMHMHVIIIPSFPASNDEIVP
jgi:hypothetical protein